MFEVSREIGLRSISVNVNLPTQVDRIWYIGTTKVDRRFSFLHFFDKDKLDLKIVGRHGDAVSSYKIRDCWVCLVIPENLSKFHKILRFGVRVDFDGVMWDDHILEKIDVDFKIHNLVVQYSDIMHHVSKFISFSDFAVMCMQKLNWSINWSAIAGIDVQPDSKAKGRVKDFF